MAIQILGIRCNDTEQRKQSKAFGGYTTYERLEKAMVRQRKKPFEIRLRPCLKYNDWWPYQAQVCVNCENGIWDLDVDGQKTVAKMSAVNGETVELTCKKTGEVFTYTIGKGFE